MPRIRGVRSSKKGLTKRFGESFKHQYTQDFGSPPSGTGATKAASLQLQPIEEFMKEALDWESIDNVPLGVFTPAMAGLGSASNKGIKPRSLEGLKDMAIGTASGAIPAYIAKKLGGTELEQLLAGSTGVLAHHLLAPKKERGFSAVSKMGHLKNSSLDSYTALKYAPSAGAALGGALGFLTAPEGSGMSGAARGALGGYAGAHAGRYIGASMPYGSGLTESLLKLMKTKGDISSVSSSVGKDILKETLAPGLTGAALGSLFGYNLLKPSHESEKEAAESDSSDRLEYETIVHMVAEAYDVDLTTPEGLENLPVIMREADKLLQKHEQLETAEDELTEQMAGEEKQETM